jgi:hypothetical protein
MKKEKLNQFTLDIEFLLISIIQGVALAALGSEAAKLLEQPSFLHILYITAGFLFVLIFWSGAIIHAVSFIAWPLDLTHNFFYFLVSLIEIIAFSYMDDPLHWFTYIFLFFLAAGILYAVDLWLIKQRKKQFSTEYENKLYQHIIKQQVFELYFLIPAGLAFNAVCIYLLFYYPSKVDHIYLISTQVVLALLFLINSTQSFKKRTHLISQAQ